MAVAHMDAGGGDRLARPRARIPREELEARTGSLIRNLGAWIGDPLYHLVRGYEAEARVAEVR